jgi:DNA-binding winged helix-turn-helix (wHTH) protein/TolB-like protein/Flp pilus assembly protein TadD
MVNKVLYFEGFALDLDRGCLLAAAAEIALRPKTFALLCFLAENPGRLIRKQELIDKVWHGGVVTDDTIVQSVGELRRALGDAGTRIIRTVPRRGYRFETTVSMEAGLGGQRATMESIDAPITAVAATHGRAALARRWGVPVVVAVAALATAALMWFGPSAPQDAKPTVAVLPFAISADDPSMADLAEGLTEEVIGELGRFSSSLTVLSLTTVLPYRDRPAPEIARSLDVRYQVQGKIQRADGRVRARITLVDSMGRVLWSRGFEEAREQLFVLVQQLTAQLVAELGERVTFLEQQRVLARRPSNDAAYDHVLRARPALRAPTRARLADARVLLKQALELAPDYAAARSALAESYYISVVQGWTEMAAENLAKAEEQASLALKSDPADLRAHIVLGRVHLFHGRYDAAGSEIRQVLEINPHDSDGLAGRGHILLWRGDTDAAIEALENAQRIDLGISFSERFALALAYYLKSGYKQAVEQAQRNLLYWGDVSAANHIVLAVSYAQLGRLDEARAQAKTVRELDPAFPTGEFGSKLQKPADIQLLREGLRKSGLYAE